MAHLIGASPASTSNRVDNSSVAIEPKHEVFLSHSGVEKDFVEQLCLDLERHDLLPFFDKRWSSLPLGENFPEHIFDAIAECHIGVVILSNSFFTSKWPMMELEAMIEKVEKRKSSFKIIPIFFGTSVKEFKDPGNRERWLSCWNELAAKTPKRVRVEKWENALKHLESINGLVYDGLGEVKFRKKIVNVVLSVLRRKLSLESLHIQGGLRLCEVISENIDGQRKNIHSVCVLGIYGMGGMGKTTLCKALCVERSEEFGGRVCHAELEQRSVEELLREVLKRLRNLSSKVLNEKSLDELWNGFERIREPIFLALDNILFSDASIQQAKRFLRTRLPSGSIVIVTARSKDILVQLRPYIDESDCMEMPELEDGEAKSLFCYSSNFECQNEMDEQLVERCIQRCRFDNGSGRFHYHPLALDVLGRQLGCTSVETWNEKLDAIDEDIFNQCGENIHPIFSILRKSYDSLLPEDQLLFMDVALFLPNDWEHSYNLFEWLGVIHNNRSVGNVMRRLEKLKAKSLIETVGDGIGSRIGIHDLWKAFGLLETKFGVLSQRVWVYETKNCGTEFIDTMPSGNCWENVKRMAITEWRTLERVNFAHFSNVIVLCISGVLRNSGDLSLKTIVIDFSGLIHLKSLTVDVYNIVVARGLQLSKLEYLRWFSEGEELPDMSSMVSLCVANFSGCWRATTVTGLSSKLTQLRVLKLQLCSNLQACPGIDDVVSLQQLDLFFCSQLSCLPNLWKLRNLRKLDVRFCYMLSELPGLSDLFALENLQASCSGLEKLSSLHRLRNLRVLDLGLCKSLGAVVGLDELLLLQEVTVDFGEGSDRPSLEHLTKLELLDIGGWNAEGLKGLGHMVMMRSLTMRSCRGMEKLPDIRNLVELRSLVIDDCDFKDLSSLCNLKRLKDLKLSDLHALLELTSIGACSQLETLKCSGLRLSELPDLSSFPRLKTLKLKNCTSLRRLGSGMRTSTLLVLKVENCNSLAFVPDIYDYLGIQQLVLTKCDWLMSMRNRWPAFPRLDLNAVVDSETSLDLEMFLGLKELEVWRCVNLKTLILNAPLLALRKLELFWCSSLQEIPDLKMFPVLVNLKLVKCDKIHTLNSSAPLPELKVLQLIGCNGLQTLPDLGILFPSLEVLSLRDCRSLMEVSSSVRLSALRTFDVTGCMSLSSNDYDQLMRSDPRSRIF